MKSNGIAESSGFSIIEAMIAIAILGVLSFGLMGLFDGLNKSQTRVNDTANIESLFGMAKFVLAAEKNCSASFGGLPASALLTLPNGQKLENFEFVVRTPAVPPSTTPTTVYDFRMNQAPIISESGASLAGYRVVKLDFIKNSPNESAQVALATGPAATPENATRVRGRLELQVAKETTEMPDGSMQLGVHSRVYQIPLSMYVRDSDSTIRKCAADEGTVEEACQTLGGVWDGTTPNLPTELRCIPQRSCIELGSFAMVSIANGGFVNQYTGYQNCPYDGTTVHPSGIGPPTVTYNGSGVVKWYKTGAITVMSSQGSGKTLQVSARAHPVVSCRRCPPNYSVEALLRPPDILVQVGDENANVSPTTPADALPPDGGPGVIGPVY
jgi:hypothetical protein